MKSVTYINLAHFAAFTLTLLISGCSPAASPMSAVIKFEGEYPSPAGKYSLSITVNTDKVVEFLITDRATLAKLGSDKTGSVYQRWFFFWESDSRLWVQSSDIGLFALWELKKGRFDEHRIEPNDPLLKSVPANVIGALPNTMKQRYRL